MMRPGDKQSVVDSLKGLLQTYEGSRGTVSWIHDNGIEDMTFRQPHKFSLVAKALDEDYEKLMGDMRKFIRMIEEARVNPDGKGGQAAPPSWKRPNTGNFPGLNSIARKFTQKLVEERERTSRE